ncbi:MAG: PIN domain-containing protein [Dermatophilaceae bacterium]
MSEGLLDTSIFIAQETGRALGPLPERTALSVVTLGELELGVRAAREPMERARRARTLARARQADPLPVTESVMSEWARLVHSCQEAGIQRTVRLTDALIAATAVVHGVPVITQDADFGEIAKAHNALRVIRV